MSTKRGKRMKKKQRGHKNNYMVIHQANNP